MTGALLVAGTTSDAGKSTIVAGICRWLYRQGVRVAPFKAQNMSNNSVVVVDPAGVGGEIGRAQAMQAAACGLAPSVAFNPVLLKPGSDLRSQVILNGRPVGEFGAGDFLGGDWRARLSTAAYQAFDDLRADYDVVVAEGAGSPTEINLRASDYVNMGLARHGQVPVIVAGDIDRGGVFAALHGTLALLDRADQALISGFVINKFRGDAALLEPGLALLEKATGRPTLGVVPWSPDLWIDAEDSLAFADGRLYLHGENGDVALVEPSAAGYREKGRFTPSGAPNRGASKAWPHPVVANGRLYIRDQELLFCYDVRGR